MRTLTLEQINELENKEPIPRFVGTITKVWDQKTGDGQYGVWCLQNLTVQQGETEMVVTWTGEDPFDAGSEGYTYSFECTTDKHEKLVGVMRDIRTSKGKTYKGIKVDNRSKIKREASEEPANKAEQGKTDWPEAEQPPLIEPQSPVHAQNGHEGVTATRKHLMQSANLLVLCIRAAEKAVAPHQPVVAQTSEQFQSDVAKLFIEASSRRTTDGVHWWSYIDLMPEVPIQ